MVPMDTGVIVAFFTSIPTDWIILFAVATFAALDSLRSGAVRACAAAIALPMAAFLAPLVEQASFIGKFAKQLPEAWGSTLVFILLFIALFVFARRMCGLWGMGTGGPLQALLSGIALAVVLACVWVATPALQGTVWHFGAQVQALFGVAWTLWWMLGAYAALAFVRE